MKILNCFIKSTFALMILALVSCRKDESAVNADRMPVTFNTSISGTVQSKAVDASWSANDPIGVYMIKGASSAFASSADLVDAASANKQYSAQAAGSSVVFEAVAGSELYYPLNDGEVKFVAYYPYNSALSATDFAYPVKVDVQSSQENIDLLYAPLAGPYKESTANSASLSFSHKLSKLIFNVTAGSGISDLSTLAVTIEGVSITAKFSLADASISNKANGDITAKVSGSSPTAKTVEAIVIPEDVTGKKIVFTISSLGSFEYTFPATTYAPGYKYMYNVALTSSGSSTEAEFSSVTINDWQSGTGGNINGNLTAGSGTQSSPYNVSQALTKSGETGKWVSGYLLGSSSALTKSFANDTKNNIVLADAAGETDPAKQIIVDLTGNAEIQDELNAVDNAALIGQPVKVKGDIVTGQGGAIWIDNLTDCTGGSSGSGDEVEFFFENMGDTKLAADKNVSQHTGWKMPNPPISYSDESGVVKVTGTLDNHIWFASNTNTSFLIHGIKDMSPAYTNIKLSYKLSATSGRNSDVIKVSYKKLGESSFTNITPANIALGTQYTYSALSDIAINIDSNEIDILRFEAISTEISTGYRLDDIKLTGTPK